MIHRVFLVLPKETAYDSQATGWREATAISELLRDVNKWIDSFDKHGCFKIYCFTEDKLALQLLATNPKINWVSVLAQNDTEFFKKIDEDLSSEYSVLSKNKISEEIIEAAKKRFKLRKPNTFIDDIAYWGHREGVLRNRIRHAANTVLKEQEFIIFFDKNHNFCNAPTPDIGDGKAIVMCNRNNLVDTVFYGGIPVGVDNLEIILKGVANEHNV